MVECLTHYRNLLVLSMDIVNFQILSLLDILKHLHNKGFSKPLIAYIAGRFVEAMPEGTVFGHAASIIEGDSGKPSIKMARLREAGCHVVENFNDLIPILQDAMA